MYCGGQPIFLLFCNTSSAKTAPTPHQNYSFYISSFKTCRWVFSLGLPSCDKANTRSDSLSLPHPDFAILGMKAWTSYASSLSIVFNI
ncbi:uncharacterized protein K441DRAFT_73244 [Cenococcum geophilum 1.58]|uniref:uncharacterized protein n=1 Tax=Cenococcum geophilum 1.58 TaxID=794803 RepID=UPI00358E15EE|nr:hypothetical protein K441DRAFT_73244 [Cenococcum geophilum 1.58]